VGEGGLRARDKGMPATKTPIFSKQGSDWLISDSKSYGNDII